MPVIRLPRQHTVSRARAQFLEAAQTVGEVVILLSMYHASVDTGTVPRCTVCYDSVYQQSDTSICTNCFGTTFEGGIKAVSRGWAIVVDNVLDQQFRKRGQWNDDDRNLQLEPVIPFMDHDYIIRVKRWDPQFRPLQLGDRYIVEDIDEISLRTGSRYGQQVIDVYALKSRMRALPTEHVIYQYAVNQTLPVLRPTLAMEMAVLETLASDPVEIPHLLERLRLLDNLIVFSNTPPTSPQVGQIWVETT